MFSGMIYFAVLQCFFHIFAVGFGICVTLSFVGHMIIVCFIIISLLTMSSVLYRHSQISVEEFLS